MMLTNSHLPVKKTVRTLLASILAGVLTGCHTSPSTSETAKSTDDQYKPREYVQLRHPDWSKNATIYQVNTRQYTPEGTFNAFEAHLPRLKAMGVDILWLMPIHPIGVKNRKGTLGSPYSVKDYYGVNPEFGTLADFRHLVGRAHSLGMHVILDWVANHSSWDNPLVTEHPDWYSRGRDGQFQPTSWRDYDDIIEFDYQQPALRKYMTQVMQYWVKETDIDGYRCDVASFVPIDFWEQTRTQLEAIKPVFLLAEAADRDLHQKAFDMTYSWLLWDNLHAITTKQAGLGGLTGGYLAEHVSIWPRNAFRMNFVDNHDKNAWEGNQYSNFGKGLYAAITLTGTIDGMPMLYSGQEAGLNRSLNFFEKDVITWKPDSVGRLYTTLFRLKHEHPALWNGTWGGEMQRIKHDRLDQVVAFSREKGTDKVITIVNLSDKPAQVRLDTRFDRGTYRDVFSGKIYSFTGSDSLSLPAWHYRVMVRK